MHELYSLRLQWNLQEKIPKSFSVFFKLNLKVWLIWFEPNFNVFYVTFFQTSFFEVIYLNYKIIKKF
jgi:hypothetical protein